MARILRLDAFARRGFERPRRRAGEGQLAIPFPARIVPLGREPARAAIDLYGLDDAGAALAHAGRLGADADDLVDIGIGAVERGQVDSGLDAFALALARDPQHSVAHYDLANVYLAREMPGPARVHLGIAVALEPTFADAYYNLGLACAASGQWPEALRALDAYLELVPEEDSVAEDLATQLRALVAELSGRSA
jgi:tetratricopeptide (TPR) repeat protein